MSGIVSSILTASGGSGTSGTINVPDYTPELVRIATALETIAAQTTIVATKLGEIESHQQKLRELGQGSGIHVVGPYEWLSMYAIYKLLLEQGVTDFASLKAQVNSLPKEF